MVMNKQSRIHEADARNRGLNKLKQKIEKIQCYHDRKVFNEHSA